MDPAVGTLAFLWMIAIPVLFVAAILWIFVPFAVFGIKPLLREILVELAKANARAAPPPPAPHREKTLAELTRGE